MPNHPMSGAPYLRALKAPLPHVEMIPTGGVYLTTHTRALNIFLASG